MRGPPKTTTFQTTYLRVFVAQGAGPDDPPRQLDAPGPRHRWCGSEGRTPRTDRGCEGHASQRPVTKGYVHVDVRNTVPRRCRELVKDWLARPVMDGSPCGEHFLGPRQAGDGRGKPAGRDREQ